MVCPLGTDSNKAHNDLQKQVDTWNQKYPSEPVYINRSSREKNGTQGRFCLPINDKSFRIPKIEFIIWIPDTSPNNKGTYDLKGQLLSVIEQARPLIEASLPRIAGCKWRLVGNHHLDHYIGSNDCESLNILHATLNTHQVPQPFNQK